MGRGGAPAARLADLPPDLLARVARHLPLGDRAALAATCTALGRLSVDASAAFWRADELELRGAASGVGPRPPYRWPPVLLCPPERVPACVRGVRRLRVVSLDVESLDLRRFAGLVELEVTVAPRLKTLDLAGLAQLERLYVRHADALAEIRGLPASLVNLDIEWADALRSLPLAGLPRLASLWFGNSLGLRACALPASLRELHLTPPDGCEPVRLEHLTQLTRLDICLDIHGAFVGRLPASLRELHLTLEDGCEPVRLGHLTQLTRLDIDGASAGVPDALAGLPASVADLGLDCGRLADLRALANLGVKTLRLASMVDTLAGLPASVTELDLSTWRRGESDAALRRQVDALSALVGVPCLAPKLAKLRPPRMPLQQYMHDILRALRDRGVHVVELSMLLL